MDSNDLLRELETSRKRIAELERQLDSMRWASSSEVSEMLFKYAPGGIAIVDLKGTILMANEKAMDMFGYSPAETIGLSTRRFYAHEHNQTELLDQMQKGRTVTNYEIELRHKDGSPVYVTLNARPMTIDGTDAALLTLADNTCLKQTRDNLEEVRNGLDGTVRERTRTLEEANESLAVLNMKLVKKNRQLEAAQKALKESESRFRTLFQNKHTVMLVIDPTTGSIVDANPAAEAYYGYSIDQLRTMNISALNTLDDLEIATEMSQANLEKRDYFQFKHRLANGSIRDVEVFSGPVKQKGRTLLYSIVHDVTDRKRAEEKLHIYERVIMYSPDMVSLVDKNYCYHMVNDTYLTTFNKTREEIIGKPVADLVGRHFYNETSKGLLDRAFAGEIVQTQVSVVIPERGTFHLAVAYHPVMDGDGLVQYVSINARDISELKKSEAELKRYSDRLSLATDAGRIGIWEWDLLANTLIWDDMMMELYRVDPAEFSAMYDAWRTRVHPDDLADTEEAIRKAMEENRLFDGEFRIVWPGGGIRHIKAAALARYRDGKAVCMTGVSWDVTKRRRMEQELRDLASTDALTGAHNRRFFMDRIHQEAERSMRYETPLSLLTLDIDHFKNVNDSYGHPIGDVVLRELVAICNKALRTSDTFSRMGGEEFSGLLPETDITAAKQTAERLRQAVERSTVETEAGSVTYTISLGVAQFDGQDDSIDEFMRRADRALYKAKNAGRNRVETG